MTSLKLTAIRTDGGTQSRAAIDPIVVEDYAQTVRDGIDLPPVVAFFDGKKYWLADGFHRLEAYRSAGAVEIEADVRQGDRRDAILFSVGANAAHGLRRSNDDKRRAVLTLLNDKEWGQWSNREVARRAAVSEKLVRSLRPERSDEDDDEARTYTTKHGTTAVMDTAKIGKRTDQAAEDESGDGEAFDLYQINGDTRTADKRAGMEEQSEFDRQRDENRESLPDSVKEHQARRAVAKAASRAKTAANLETLEAEIEELREANASLEAELAALKADNARWQDMKVQFEQGGFEKVVAGKDEEIRVLQSRLETESADKASWMKSAKFWKAEAERLGYGEDDIIPLEPKGVAHG